MYPKRFYDYNTFLREKFGEKVYKISLDAGFTCPNRDGTVGTGGCIYCNNSSFSLAARQKLPALKEQIISGMEIGKKFKAKKFIVYFQAYTNTYAPVSHLERLYHEALDYPNVVGIAIGTRPDVVDEEKIELLTSLAKKTFVSVEYGVQTRNNQTLLWINRGHTWESFLHAMDITRGRGIHICAHIMLGFPGESREKILSTACEMNRLGIGGIKLHNLIISQGTPLARIYEETPFPLFTEEEYVVLVCDFIERLASHIVIERLMATAPKEYIIAPRWAKTPAQMSDAVTKMLGERKTYQGFLAKS
jgi:radical SAM protein (TIGR01212 family)